jgi:hypothetical protein
MTADTVPSDYSGEELRALRGAHRYQEWIAEQFRPYLHGTLMEIGAGIGTMAQKWLAHVQRLHLVEPAPNLHPELSERFRGHANVTLHSGLLDQVLARADAPRPGSLDGVVMINVLEHIEDEIAELRLIHSLLAPGGHLMVFVPAMQSLYGSLDRRFGHYRRYARAGLRSLCENVGFETVRLRYFDVLGVLPWWVVNRVLRRDRIGQGSAAAYDRFAVPVGRWLEKRVAFPFGKNLVYVGRRR